MKKTLLASAVTLATLTTGTFAADTTPQIDSAAALAQRLDSMPQVYGNVQLAWVYSEADKNILSDNGDVEFFEGSTVSGLEDNGSTIGLTHEHEISPGLEAFMKIELDGIDGDDKAKGRGRIKLDEAYIGLKGDFGQVWVGSDDSAYERLIDGIKQYYEIVVFNTGTVYNTGEGDLLQYTSPSFSGLTLHGAVELDGSFEDADGNDVGGENPYQLGVQYADHQFSLAVAMDSNDSSNAGNTYGVRGAFQMGDLELSALYSTTTDVRDDYGLMAIYSMGANTFAASYEFSTPDGDGEDTSVISLQALHSFSDNLYVYTELYFVTSDEEGFIDINPDDADNSLVETGADATHLALGAVYAF
ncbi:porin [Allohahella sp. A8]|uniref:porin n=1 Tax=Allohahella sp. A8 TaxID=3141461 RepID=UPI003A801542